MPEIIIEVSIRHPSAFVDHELLRSAIRRVLTDEGIHSAMISLAIVGDAEIHQVNREFLGHDYSTDVISFLLSDSRPETGDCITNPNGFLGVDESTSEDSLNSDRFLAGELVISIETAIREASVHGWSLRAELLLYVVHGLLHLCGYDDLTDEARSVMRSRERELLSFWGYCPTGLEM